MSAVMGREIPVERRLGKRSYNPQTCDECGLVCRNPTTLTQHRARRHKPWISGYTPYPKS